MYSHDVENTSWRKYPIQIGKQTNIEPCVTRMDWRSEQIGLSDRTDVTSIDSYAPEDNGNLEVNQMKGRRQKL